MMSKLCACFHHKLAMVLSGLVFLSGLAFFWTAINGLLSDDPMAGLLLGFPAPFYFQAAVVLVLMEIAMKACRCCCGGMRCGTDGCGVCKVDDKSNNNCSHEDSCKCGDCGRCK